MPPKAVCFLTLVVLFSCTGQDTGPPSRRADGDDSMPPYGNAGINAPDTIRTTKGTFVVPGQAYMDGRDPNASPPLTLMLISLWDGVPRSRQVGKIGHGTPVKLLAQSTPPLNVDTISKLAATANQVGFRNLSLHLSNSRR